MNICIYYYYLFIFLYFGMGCIWMYARCARIYLFKIGNNSKHNWLLVTILSALWCLFGWYCGCYSAQFQYLDISIENWTTQIEPIEWHIILYIHSGAQANTITLIFITRIRIYFHSTYLLATNGDKDMNSQTHM